MQQPEKMFVGPSEMLMKMLHTKALPRPANATPAPANATATAPATAPATATAPANATTANADPAPAKASPAAATAATKIAPKKTPVIDLRTIPISVPSLCIPSAYANISESRIRRVFDALNLGIIERVDIVRINRGEGRGGGEEKAFIGRPAVLAGRGGTTSYNRVFIHFRRWFNDETASTFRERMLTGGEGDIVYEDPLYWKVSAYRQDPVRAASDADAAAKERAKEERFLCKLLRQEQEQEDANRRGRVFFDHMSSGDAFGYTTRPKIRAPFVRVDGADFIGGHNSGHNSGHIGYNTSSKTPYSTPSEPHVQSAVYLSGDELVQKLQKTKTKMSEPPLSTTPSYLTALKSEENP